MKIYDTIRGFEFLTISPYGVFILILVGAIVGYYVQISLNNGPPTVWPALPFIGDAYQFAYNATGYTQRCHRLYGPIFRCLVGGRRIVIICDGVGCQAILRDKSRALSTHVGHQDMAIGVAGVRADVSHYLPGRLLPPISEIFSGTELTRILPTLNHNLHHYIAGIRHSAHQSRCIPLVSLVGEPLYSAVSHAVFGTTFPVSTFHEFMNIDMNFIHLMTHIPFVANSARQSRTRLLASVGEYIDSASCNSGTVPEPAAKILDILADLHLQASDRNGLLLLFMWGLHSSVIRAVFWLFAHLLDNPDHLRCLVDEIDQVIEKHYPDIQSLLDAPYGTLDGPEFSLLTSAIKEAIRISSVIIPLREVCEDTFVTLGSGQTYPLRKGEFVVANLPMVHHDGEAYPNPFDFEINRFLGGKGKNTIYSPWGGGDHMCKGRLLAMHVMKLFSVLVLRTLDLSAVNGLGMPLSHPFLPPKLEYMQLWQMRTSDPVHVCIRARSS